MSLTLETSDQFIFLFIVQVVEFLFVHQNFLVEEEVLVRDGLDLGADFRADKSEKKCFGLVADIKVGRLARVQEALVEKAFASVMSADNVAFLRLLDNFA